MAEYADRDRFDDRYFARDSPHPLERGQGLGHVVKDAEVQYDVEDPEGRKVHRHDGRSGRRKAAGEGSIYRISEGNWRAVADLGRCGGRRQRKYVRGATQAEVLQELRELQRKDDAGVVHRNGTGPRRECRHAA